jgi:AcrR family transcriptional regulator
MSDTARLTRAERRARTERAILEAARELFCESGYQGTTIRGVAARAGVDPALVMQYYGSKDALFGQAAHLDLDFTEALPGPVTELGERMLTLLLERLENNPQALLSTLRSMLTHEQAAQACRMAFAEQQDPVEDLIGGDDAQLRSKLIGTIMIGLLVARYLLRIGPVAQASPQRLIELLGPCLRPLTTPAQSVAPTDDDDHRPAPWVAGSAVR